jgi:hypothetical protein
VGEMAGGVNRKISAASARAHTRKARQKSSFQLPSGGFSFFFFFFRSDTVEVFILPYFYRISI